MKESACRHRARVWTAFVIVLSALVMAEANADTLDDYFFAQARDLSKRMLAHMPTAPRGHWMDDPEVRITPERDEFDLARETYSFRFRPTRRKERKSMQQFFNIENELTNVEWNKSVSDALANRYHDVIDLAQQEVSYALITHHLTLDRSFLNSEQTLSATSDFSSSRLQGAALRLELREQEGKRAERQIEQLRTSTILNYLDVSGSRELQVSTRLVNPQAIENVLQGIMGEPASTAYESSLASLEVRRAEQQVLLEKSRTGFGLSLLELSYENKIVDSYNMTFGFRFPFGRPTYSSQGRAREIRWKIDAYNADEVALQNLFERLPGVSDDVSSLVVLRRHQLELRESVAETRIALLHDFVDLLDLVGLLQQQPLKNWIKGT